MNFKQLFSFPNLLCYFRIGMIPVFAYTYLQAETSADYLSSALILGIMEFTDFLDGFIARKYHMVTEAGKSIDPIADKVTVTVTENSAAVTYDGTEHSVTGYKSMTADNTLYDVEKNVAEKPTKAWTAKGTDAGEYPVGIVSGDFRNTSKNFTNVEFVIMSGARRVEKV